MSRVAMMVRVDDRPAPLPAMRALFFCVVGRGPAVFMNWARSLAFEPSKYLLCDRYIVWWPFLFSRSIIWSSCDLIMPW